MSADSDDEFDGRPIVAVPLLRPFEQWALGDTEGFLSWWFGKRNDESLGEAMERRAMEPNAFASFLSAAPKKDGEP